MKPLVWSLSISAEVFLPYTRQRKQKNQKVSELIFQVKLFNAIKKTIDYSNKNFLKLDDVKEKKNFF